MSYTTIRISSDRHRELKELARRSGSTLQATLDEAIEGLRRARFLSDVNAAYARIREDATASRDVDAERRSWDVTLADGLEVSVRASGGRRASHPPKRGTRK